MDEMLYQLNKLLPYFITFPIIIILLSFILWLISRKKITNKTIGFYGIIMEFNNKEIISLSLLLTHTIIIIESLFINEFSIYNLFFIIIPILAFNIFNKYLINALIDTLITILITILLFFKAIFYSYTIEVISSWEVITIIISLIIFIISLTIYNLFRNISFMLRQKKA